MYACSSARYRLRRTLPGSVSRGARGLGTIWYAACGTLPGQVPRGRIPNFGFVGYCDITSFVLGFGGRGHLPNLKNHGMEVNEEESHRKKQH